MGSIDVANQNSLDLNLIRVFDALLRERSATRAGERIGLSQPAVSAALNRLRDSEAKSRVVVLITDGDNNAGRVSPSDAAQMASAGRGGA